MSPAPPQPSTPSSGDGPPGRISLGPHADVNESDLDFNFIRGSGPGGQAVNKVASAAQLRVAVTAILGLDDRARDRLRRLAGQRLVADDHLLIQSRNHRSQSDNRRACLARLTQLVTEAARPPRRRKPTKPSRGSIERRLENKKQRGEKKQRRNWRPGD